METPTRLTSSGPVGGPTRESLTGREPSGIEEGSGLSQSDSGPTRADLSDETKALLDRVDILIERFRDLSASLAKLADFLPEEVSGQATRMRERVDSMIEDLKQLRQEVRQEGALQVFRDVVSDYSDIAQSIATRAQSLRTTGGNGETAPTVPTEASSDATGGTATALMFFGGAALTAWFLFRESGQGDDENGEAGNQTQSPGDVAPAGGALIGQF